MKAILLTTISILFFLAPVLSQVAINGQNTAPHSSAMLDISSSSKGVLIPRMNSTQRGNLPNPATGLMVYDSSTNSFWYWAGSWKEVSAGAGTISGKAAGDLDGVYPEPTVVGLMGRQIDHTPASDMQVLKWHQASSQYKFQNDSLFLPYQGASASVIPSFAVTNTAIGLGGSAILGRRLAGSGSVPGASGVWGDNSSGIGVSGTSANSYGVFGVSNSTHGVYGVATGNNAAGVYGKQTGAGSNIVPAISMGVWGDNSNGVGVVGTSDIGVGTYGVSKQNHGVSGYAISNNYAGVYGSHANAGAALMGEVQNAGVAIYGKAGGNQATAARFENTNTNNIAPLISATNKGSGAGISYTSTYSGYGFPGISMDMQGVSDGIAVSANLGRAAVFQNLNSSSPSDLVKLSNWGTGATLNIESKTTTNSTEVQKVLQAGLGKGIDIEVANGSSSAAGLNVTTAGQRGITADVQGQFGIYAVSFANNGIGVEGRNNGNNGIGVRGLTFANTLNPVGVSGENSSGSSFGIGVRGKAATNDNKGIGVYGTNFTSEQDRGAVTGENQASGVGVYGRSLFTGYGVLGLSTTPYNAAGAGVYGLNTNGGTAMKALSEGPLATAFEALANPSSGFGIGVVGQSWGNGDGVRGFGGGNGNGVSGFSFNNNSSSGVYGSDNTGATLGKAAKFEIASSANTSEAVNISNAGLGRSLYMQQTNASNTQTMLQFRKYGTSDYAVFRDGSNAAKIRFDNTGKGFFNGGTQVGGADMAEAFDVEDNFASYEPGDVLVISTEKDRTVVRSAEAYSKLVAGVYATKPGVLMSEEQIDSDMAGKLPMGVLGVIPTKVCTEGGAIHRGDLLVTSSIAGVAMKADPAKLQIGQILGKALENFDAANVAKIKVLVNVK